MGIEGRHGERPALRLAPRQDRFARADPGGNGARSVIDRVGLPLLKDEPVLPRSMTGLLKREAGAFLDGLPGGAAVRGADQEGDDGVLALSDPSEREPSAAAHRADDQEPQDPPARATHYFSASTNSTTPFRTT